MGTLSRERVVTIEHISKSFPGIKANDDISFDLRKGEIHALLGENGAGKSTLMSILFGLYTPDEGNIYINGEKVEIKNPNDANRYGIGMVHQHFMLVDCYTGLENIVLGVEPKNKLGLLDFKETKKEVEELSKKYSFDVDFNKKVEDMSVGEQQKIEILKTLYRKNDILIFDEPTAVLTPQEIDSLMLSLRNLAREGKSIIFISHKLNEIMEVSDRVTVLRKGKCLGTFLTKDTNPEKLSTLMVGRDVELSINKTKAKPGKIVLELKNVCVYDKERKRDSVKDVSFKVRAGEILCIAGIEGNGQSDLVFGLAGLKKIVSGNAILFGVDTAIYGRHRRNGDKKKETLIDIDLADISVRKRNIAGLAHIPEDRHKYGTVLDFSLSDNLIMEKYFETGFQRFGFRNKKKTEEYAKKLIKTYDIRSGKGTATQVRSMSGGNQQKLIIARELDRKTPLIIAVQPTRGLDVGAVEFIHNELIKRRDEGAAILLISLELDEVMNLSDRIVVMHNGEIVAELDPSKTNRQEIGLYMSGSKRMEGF
jgi:simple sugar transport system ATP-binding protein